jgi:hypothetical protein
MVQLWQRHPACVVMLSLPSTLPTHTIPQQPNSNSNQDQRKKQLANAEDVEDAEISQQEQATKGDEQNGPKASLLGPVLERILVVFADLLCFQRAYGIDGHVKGKDGQRADQNGFRAFTQIQRDTKNDAGKNYNVEQCFVVFAVVDGAETGNQPEQDYEYG